MQTRGFGMTWMGPEEFGTFMARADAESGALMKATGLAR
jgi:hypothetical protein